MKELENDTINMFLKHINSKNTRRSYKTTLNLYKDYCIACDLDWYKREAATAYFDYNFQYPYSDNTRKLRIQVIKHFMSFYNVDLGDISYIKYKRKTTKKDINDVIAFLKSCHPAYPVNNEIKEINRYEKEVKEYLIVLLLILTDYNLEMIADLKRLDEETLKNNVIRKWYYEYLNSYLYANNSTEYLFANKCNNQIKYQNIHLIINKKSNNQLNLSEIKRILENKILVLVDEKTFL